MAHSELGREFPLRVPVPLRPLSSHSPIGPWPAVSQRRLVMPGSETSLCNIRKVWVRAGGGQQGGDPLGYFFQMHMSPLRQPFQNPRQCALFVPSPFSSLFILFASAVTQDIPAGRQPRGHIVLP